MKEIAWAGMSVLVLVLTVLPWSRSEVWWVRGWDFPRLQLALLALALAIATGFAFEIHSAFGATMLLSNAACFLYQFIRIVPYTRLARREVRTGRNPAADRRLRILSSNVLISNSNFSALIEQIRIHRPDMVVTLETDVKWERQLAVIESDYPHAVKHPLSNAYGMHVYSRFPIEHPVVEYLVQRGVPSIHATVILRSGDRVRVHFLHPAPPSPTENERSTERDAELVIVAKRVVQENGPVIVTGDLNDVAWSSTTKLFRKISRLLDPRIGRGMFNTFHARWFFMRWPLDHLFHSRHFTLVQLCRLPSIGSDHFPILVELALEPERAPEQEGPAPDAEDERRAREKITRARERS